MEVAVFTITEKAVARSVGLIGRENPEWEPLKYATLRGGQTAAGRYYPGKIAKGQVGRISATDPLLGRGDMPARPGEAGGLAGARQHPGAVQPRGGSHDSASAAGSGPMTR